MGLRRHVARNVIGALIAPLIIAAVAMVSIATSPTSQAEALDDEESSFLSILNDYRAQNGLGPVVIDERLNSVARWMANDMAANDYFSHTDSVGRDPFTRMDQLGYAVNTWRGENLVAGTMGAAQSFQMWRDSEGHRQNMLGANYTAVGIARAYDANSSFGWYWATEFGGEAVGAPPPQAPPPAPEPEPEPPTYVAPEPEAAAPAPQEEAAPPPQAPTIAPAPAAPAPAAPVHAADGKAPWFHAVSFVVEKEVSDGFWGDAIVRVLDLMDRTFSGSASRAAH